MQKKSLKIWNLRRADQVSPASWQSVFGFLYWGARPEEPGHNRSSSPFTTLADIAERKVVSTGAGQPNYWPKKWFGANAYNAKFGVPNYTLKSVQTLLSYYGAQLSPVGLTRTKVYGCDLIRLSKEKKEKGVVS